MKKVLVAAMAVALAAAMCVPASAFENEFGGYWRTRAYTQQDFSGDKTESADLQQVDTRTRLYYTAKFSDDFKFVNKFEFDGVWGDTDDDSYGDVGTDGVAVEVKNSYVDFNLGYYNFKIGAQAGYLGRGFIMDDDFAGAVITANLGDISVPFYWIKNYEGGEGKDKNKADMDTIVITPEFKSGNLKVSPYLSYTYIDKAKGENIDDLAGDELVEALELDENYPFSEQVNNSYLDLKVATIGLDLDLALTDNSNIWFSGFYQYGELNGGLEVFSGDAYKAEADISAYLMAFGGNIDVEGIDIHGQFFYASGNDQDELSEDNFDDATNKLDFDLDGFMDVTQGQSYYWAEIMGYGMVDNQVSAGSCADKISNIMAFNIGASMSPVEKLTVGADIWYAMLAEDDAAGEDYLGTELDLTASYKVIDNLTLDVVAAYLFAGDATGEEDPMEIGAQLSLSF
ncbi:MAG: hypothetical protein RBR08_01395 [Desulforegulaceae bacterium]|nr:hypothetical protein [Desulforegulaceae bacterium]